LITPLEVASSKESDEGMWHFGRVAEFHRR